MPDGLTLWEAQFGDFCNVAQVIVDQFISSAEDKWHRLSGLVLLLPHGYEGQGPEHSSARLERFLVLAAEDNLFVVNLTTPAQLFHCLRRQVLSTLRKPLVVMSPKSLLRHPRAVSPLAEFYAGRFHEVLDDPVTERESIRRIVLVAGKLFYDLEEARRERGLDQVALIRIEQLYPFPAGVLQRVLAGYPEQAEVWWAQEEPRNMGAWPFLSSRCDQSRWGRPLAGVVARPEAASPATGSPTAHREEQQLLIDQALTLTTAR
jgi:2-oxoglutarate dehydrogenase E1 component